MIKGPKLSWVMRPPAQLRVLWEARVILPRSPHVSKEWVAESHTGHLRSEGVQPVTTQLGSASTEIHEKRKPSTHQEVVLM